VSTVERDPDLEVLLEFLRDERGFDFTGYKRPTLIRRITKRMQDMKIASFADYRAYLDQNPDEFAALFDTILINVTSFFRDPAAWEYIAAEIVPRIVATRDDADPIRIWSTGCATGEEAYTTAILFAEAMGDEAFRRQVKIYATDVDHEALNRGRQAVFTSEQVETVPEELRERYFEASNGNLAFRADLRRSVIFGRHDLVQDPPISRIDLLISRNTLMYFDTDTQRRILSSFHFALRNDGYLFLGKSEVLIARSPLFAAVDLKRRVFAKVPAPPVRAAREQSGELDRMSRRAAGALCDAGFESSPVAQLVIDREGRLTLANMQARMLFGLRESDLGTLLQDLEFSYRPVELRSRIEQMYAAQHPITLRDVAWHLGAEVRLVDIQLVPLISPDGDVLGVGVNFTDVTRYRRLQEALQDAKREVDTANEELQSTIEELETTNEELQSTNEELETTNEELQSTNEELETMNEELQSTNEELEAINDELHQRTDELHELNAFLETVLAGLSEGVVVVDGELRVQAWNEAAQELWGLRREEVTGRHFLNLDIGLPVDRLRTSIRATLAGEQPDELDVEAVNRRGHTIRCRLRFAPLALDGTGVRGAIVMMQADGEVPSS
jgi:two-component system, chemotaxis family, CheB/CheR fusion protein